MLDHSNILNGLLLAPKMSTLDQKYLDLCNFFYLYVFLNIFLHDFKRFLCKLFW